MGSAFHQLCPRYSGTLTPTAPTAIRLWDTFTFFIPMLSGDVCSKCIIDASIQPIRPPDLFFPLYVKTYVVDCNFY